MIPTARVQRGPYKAARCASMGIIPATPHPFFSILLQTNKLIRLLFQPDFGLRSMPRHHDRGILQRVQPLPNGLLDGFEVSAPEISAANAAAKECVAGQDHVVDREMKTHGPG